MMDGVKEWMVSPHLPWVLLSATLLLWIGTYARRKREERKTRRSIAAGYNPPRDTLSPPAPSSSAESAAQPKVPTPLAESSISVTKTKVGGIRSRSSTLSGSNLMPVLEAARSSLASLREEEHVHQIFKEEPHYTHPAVVINSRHGSPNSSRSDDDSNDDDDDDDDDLNDSSNDDGDSSKDADNDDDGSTTGSSSRGRQRHRSRMGRSDSSISTSSIPILPAPTSPLPKSFSTSDFPVSPRGKAAVRLTRFSGWEESNAKVDVVPDAQIETAELLSKVRMTWVTPPSSVFVVKKWRSPEVSEKTQELVALLTTVYDLAVFVEPSVKESEYPDNEFVFTLPPNVDVASVIDLVVCMGGDGTLLHSTTYFYKSVPPIVSFALGSLGFLTPFDFARAPRVLDKVLKGNFFLTLRSRLVCSIIGTDAIDPLAPVAQFQILNDMVIDRGPAASLASLDIYCDQDFITSVQADGIIVATATGSTAYSMSAGGSIVHPGVPCILLTPICPHSVSFRPIIFPHSSTIRIRVAANARNTAWVSFDGRSRTELQLDQTIQCSVSPWSVPTVCKRSETADWLVSLRKNMHWNRRTQQKPFKAPPVPDPTKPQ